jgi:hypothetical protein
MHDLGERDANGYVAHAELVRDARRAVAARERVKLNLVRASVAGLDTPYCAPVAATTVAHDVATLTLVGRCAQLDHDVVWSASRMPYNEDASGDNSSACFVEVERAKCILCRSTPRLRAATALRCRVRTKVRTMDATSPCYLGAPPNSISQVVCDATATSGMRACTVAPWTKEHLIGADQARSHISDTCARSGELAVRGVR